MRPRAAPALFALVTLALLVAAPAGTVAAASTTLQPAADSYISALFSGTNYGSEPILMVGKRIVTTSSGGVTVTSSEETRILIRFDLSSISGLVTSARLVLTVNVTDSSHDVLIEVHPLLADFSESEVTWDEREAGAPWSSTGGDFDPTVIDRVLVGAGTRPGTEVEIDLTSYVRGVRNGTFPDCGIILVPGPTLGWVKFYSSESARSAGRPRLEVGTSVVVPFLTIPLSALGGTSGGSGSGSASSAGSGSGTWSGGGSAGSGTGVGYPVVVAAVAPAAVRVPPGTVVNFSVGVWAVGCPSVSLSASGGPPGSSPELGTAAGPAPLVTWLSVEVSEGTPPGTYPLTVSASGCGAADSETVSVEVVEVPEPDLATRAVPALVVLERGGSAELKVEVIPLWGFSDPVTVGVSGLPPGISAEVSGDGSPPPLVTTVSLSAGEVTPGTYELTVEARGGSGSASCRVAVVVPASGGTPGAGAGRRAQGPGVGGPPGGAPRGPEGGETPAGGGPAPPAGSGPSPSEVSELIPYAVAAAGAAAVLVGAILITRRRGE